MSAAATAAGYLFASGILDRRRQAKAEMLNEQSVVEVLQEGQRISIQPTYVTPRAVKVTYRKRRI